MTALSMFCADANRHQRAEHDTRLVDQTRRHGQEGRRSQHPGVERLAGLRGSGGQVVKGLPGWARSVPPAVKDEANAFSNASEAKEDDMARGITTIAHLKARSTVDTATHCWHWHGASIEGRPRIWAFDHDKGEKTALSGPLAAWNIAHGRSPLAGWIVFRACMSADCVNPAHMREARDRAEIGRHIRLSGRWVGTNLETRRANVAVALAALGREIRA